MRIQHMPFLQVLLATTFCSSGARLGGGSMCTYRKLILRIQAFGVKVELRLIFMQDPKLGEWWHITRHRCACFLQNQSAKCPSGAINWRVYESHYPKYQGGYASFNPPRDPHILHFRGGMHAKN